MIIHKFKGYTLCQSDNWQYTVIDEENNIVTKSASSFPLTREEAHRIINLLKPGARDDREVEELSEDDERN